MGFKCLFLIITSHQSMIQAEQFYEDAHRELSGEGRSRNGLSKAGGIKPGMIQE